MELTTTQKELLNTLQWDFPLVEEPFSEIGAGLGLTGAEVIDQIATLKDEAIIRELNAIFDTRRLGYKSSLVAVRAPEDRVDDVAAVISEHPGVSHNYKRDHYFNIWFTLAVPPGKRAGIGARLPCHPRRRRDVSRTAYQAPFQDRRETGHDQG